VTVELPPPEPVLLVQARSASNPLASWYCAMRVGPPVKLVPQEALASELTPAPATHNGEAVIGYLALNSGCHAVAKLGAVVTL